MNIRKIGIMQPYFLPYLGYYQLIHEVDTFIIYDNIQFSKRGWINRNRILLNDQDTYFTLPLVKDSDYLDVVDRLISPSFNHNKQLSQIRGAYIRAPFIDEIYPHLIDIFSCEERNLFKFIYNSILKTCQILDIQTDIIISSSVNIDHQLKAQDKVIELCKATGATHYINPMGGQELYSKNDFIQRGIRLAFINSQMNEYKQFNREFLPALSIIDVLMFNGISKTRDMLNEYNLI